MGRSGKLLALNDKHIEDLLLDERYEIREDGSIWTTITKQGHENGLLRRADTEDSQGYHNISYTTSDRKRKRLSVHRIIFAKFVGNLEPDMMINHINGVTSDNRPQNLELITQGANNEHRFRVLKSGPVVGHKKINDQIANDIRRDRSKGMSYKELMKKYELAKSTISYIVNNKTWNREQSVI